MVVVTEDTSSGSTAAGSGSGAIGNQSSGLKAVGCATDDTVERECPFGSILIDLDECPALPKVPVERPKLVTVEKLQAQFASEHTPGAGI